MATTLNQLRREVLIGVRDNENEISRLLDRAVTDLNSAARTHKSSMARFEKAAIAIIAAFYASYIVLSRTSNKAIAQSFVTFIDNTIGKNLIKANAINSYNDMINIPPTTQRPLGTLQVKLEAAHNSGNAAEEARLNKLVDPAMRTDTAGTLNTKVREEFLKAMKAGKPITMTEAEKRAAKSATSSYAESVSKRVIERINPADGKSIERRIVTLKRGSDRVVRGLIEIGNTKNMSVNQVAKMIQGYIDPRSQAGTRFTAGNAQNYRAVKLGKTLPKGSIRYNAVRIARSEMMYTYDLAGQDFYDDKAWSNGWNWILSNTHKHVDDCDYLANHNPHKKMPQRPHPQCTCNAQPVLPTLKDFERLVKSGKIS